MGNNDYVWVCDLDQLLEIGTVADHQVGSDHGDPWFLRIDAASTSGGRSSAAAPGSPTGWVLVPTLRETRDEPQRLAALPDYSRS